MTKQQTSIKRNFVMNAILSMSSFIFPLITFPYVSRILLPTGTGKVSFATSLISYFLMFAQLGIPTYGIRACARVRNDSQKLTQTAQELLIINLVMGCVSYLLLTLALLFVPRLQEDRPLFLLVSITIFITAFGMEWLYKALEQYTYITVRSIAFKFLALIALFCFVHTQDDYLIYGGITIFASSASNILNFIHCKKYISLKPLPSYSFKQHLAPIAVFFSMSCATTVYTHLDTVMLGFMSTDLDVGYYAAAVRIKSILVSVVTSLGAVILPRASYYIEHNQLESFHAISRKALNFVFLAACPLVIYFMLFAQQGILFLSGEAYYGAILPMQIVMPTILLIGLTNIMGIQMLVPLGREKAVLCSEIIGALVNLILNSLLIPKYAAAGAALGTLVAEITVLIVQSIALWSEVHHHLRAVQYRKILLALFSSTAATFWLTGLQANAFLVLIISAILFFAVYAAVLLLTKETLFTEVFHQVLRKVFKRQ